MAEVSTPGVRITNDNELKAWLESIEDRRVLYAFATRNALRCLPTILPAGTRTSVGNHRVDSTLAVLRATLVSGIAGTWTSPAMTEQLVAAANSAHSIAGIKSIQEESAGDVYAARTVTAAAHAAGAVGVDSKAADRAYSTAQDTYYAAHGAGATAGDTAYLAGRADRTNYAAYAGDAFKSAASAARMDAEFLQAKSPLALFEHSLWFGSISISSWASAWETFRTLTDPENHWDFWRRWYQGFLDGSPIDWKLQRRVALGVSEEAWEAGIEAVAREIAQIEEDWKSKAREDQSATPESVSEAFTEILFTKALFVRASMGSLAEAIELRVDAFDRSTRPNEVIPFLETLRQIPLTARRIEIALGCEAKENDSHPALAHEVGKLRAECELLRKQLSEAHKEIAELKKKPWFKSASILLCGSAISAIVVGLYTLSGDEKTLEDRWTKLAADLNFVKSGLWPDSESEFDDIPRFELPEAKDT